MLLSLCAVALFAYSNKIFYDPEKAVKRISGDLGFILSDVEHKPDFRLEIKSIIRELSFDGCNNLSLRVSCLAQRLEDEYNNLQTYDGPALEEYNRNKLLSTKTPFHSFDWIEPSLSKAFSHLGQFEKSKTYEQKVNDESSNFEYSLLNVYVLQDLIHFSKYDEAFAQIASINDVKSKQISGNYCRVGFQLFAYYKKFDYLTALYEDTQCGLLNPKQYLVGDFCKDIAHESLASSLEIVIAKRHASKWPANALSWLRSCYMQNIFSQIVFSQDKQAVPQISEPIVSFIEMNDKPIDLISGYQNIIETWEKLMPNPALKSQGKPEEEINLIADEALIITTSKIKTMADFSEVRRSISANKRDQIYALQVINNIEDPYIKAKGLQQLLGIAIDREKPFKANLIIGGNNF